MGTPATAFAELSRGPAETFRQFVMPNHFAGSAPFARSMRCVVRPLPAGRQCGKAVDGHE